MERRLFHLLAAIALLYAFLAGLKTVADSDLFWQLATGRWVAQHHRVFSVEVFSYTAAGQPWIYPAGSALIFYAVYLLGGYSLLSCLGALTSAGTIALLLRKGSAVSAAIAILAVPLIAQRTVPRAQMFTALLFAAYLSILWENYRSGRGRLRVLPLLMMAWVNLHPGFMSGLALIVAFAGMDVLELLFAGERRREASLRLRRAWPWFVATGISTLVNPWGWGVYTAILSQNRAMAEHTEWIAEWGRTPLNWAAISGAMSPRGTQPFYLLLVILAIAACLALLQRQIGPALLLVAAAYPSIQHVRMDALTASVVIVVGGTILATAVEQAALRLRNQRSTRVLAWSATALVAVLALFRTVDLFKVHETSVSEFGVGVSSWYPEHAAEFIQREHVPGEIWNSYVDGGFVAWRLGPERRDYIDGRAIPFGTKSFLLQAQLEQSPADSQQWLAEADRYNINAILLPVDRFEAVLGQLKTFCNSANWKPVYLDELAGVFVRRKPENEDFLRRFEIDCSNAPLPRQSVTGSAPSRFAQWANAAGVLAALGRSSEALAAADQAGTIYPDSSYVPWLRGNVYYTMGLLSDAKREYLKAISLDSTLPLFWYSLATVYKHEGRIPETIEAQQRGIRLSTMSQPFELLKLARLYLDVQQPKAALETFNEAVRVASPEILARSRANRFKFEADQGRAAAWRALGDPKKAAEFDQEAVQDIVPDNQQDR